VHGGQSTPPPCSVSNILDNYWLRTVTRISLSCTAILPIQAESNELFGVITKRIFVKIFRKFQMHSFRRFSRDVQLQRLRDGVRHLLVINLMRAAIKTRRLRLRTRGHSCRGCVNQTCKTTRHHSMAASIRDSLYAIPPTHRRHRRH